MILAAAGDALTLFLGLETMSIGAYALTAFRRASPRSAEGALKYFLLGSFAAALLVYGFALLYGATGHTDLAGIGAAAHTAVAPRAAHVVGAVLVLVGLALQGERGAVPHVDAGRLRGRAHAGHHVHGRGREGRGVRDAAARPRHGLRRSAWASWASGWPPVLAALAVADDDGGEPHRGAAGVGQAHAGVLEHRPRGLPAARRDRAAAGAQAAAASVLFYLLAYTVSTAGAFGALILCGSRGREAVTYDDLSGLGKRHPAAALAFSLFLVSLAGIPPTAGFFGKWFIFRAAIDGGLYGSGGRGPREQRHRRVLLPARLVYMYMREPAAGAPVAVPIRSGYVTAALLVSALLVLVLGLTPTHYLDVALEAAGAFAKG